jgi:hypothetical protein
MPYTGSEIVSLRLSPDLVGELDAQAAAEGTTRMVVITRALEAAGYHVPAYDLEDRTPRRRRAEALMTLDLDWQRYLPARHDNEPCLYMLLYIPFNFAPRYVGETMGFLSRLDTHGKNFRNCKYTVLLRSFIEGAQSRTHRDFMLRWQQVGSLPSHVFVPGVPAGQMINPADSLAHWSDLVPLVCPLLGSSPHNRQVLETRVRMDLEARVFRRSRVERARWSSRVTISAAARVCSGSGIVVRIPGCRQRLMPPSVLSCPFYQEGCFVLAWFLVPSGGPPKSDFEGPFSAVR